MRSFLLRFLLLLAASYGLLYFSHKFYQPTLVYHGDFLKSYYWMFQDPLDFAVANSPWVYRQVSAVLTHALFAAGVYYPNETAFANPAIDPRLFFAALATNYLGLVLSGALAGEVTRRETNGFVFPLLAGLFCVLSFHTQSVVITGLTEGVTWLFFAALYLLYVRESRVAFAVLLALSIFQREVIPIVFGLIAAFAQLIGGERRRYNLFVLAVAVACFAGYLLIRFYVIVVPGSAPPLSPSAFIGTMFAGPIELRDLTFAGLLSQNVILIAIGVGSVRWLKERRVPRELLVLLLSFAGLVILGLGSGVDANIGRVAGFMTPAFAALAARDLFRLEEAARARRVAA
jgi:hypothetical protein